MSTSNKTFEFTYDEVMFRLNVIFVRGSSPAEWVGNTQCFLCAHVLESKQPGSIARIKSNLRKAIVRHMKKAHDA